jgi:predicted dehydrogenase
MDPRQDRLDVVSDVSYVKGTYTSLDAALDQKNKVDGVVVASPPVFHVDQAIQALDKGLPVLLEKPVSPDEKSAHRLQAAVSNTMTPLLLGYTWRWWSPLRQVKQLLDQNEIGKLRSVQFVMSAHLADWHPWENYREFFMASKELGGGALLDESHWIDLMLWFLGNPKSVYASIDKISDLDIDADDNVDLVIHYEDGLVVTMHLDLYGRPHQKYIRFIGEDGTIFWTADPNQVAVSHDMEGNWKETQYDCERNDMFLATAKEFVSILDGESKKTCHIGDGVKVMAFIEAARESSNSKSVVSIN